MAKKITDEVRITDADLADFDRKKIIATAKEPANANKLTKQRIDKLFRMFCVHRGAYNEAGPTLIEVKTCSACILCEIPWQHMVDVEVAGGIDCKVEVENLCYAIWHEGILND